MLGISDYDEVKAAAVLKVRLEKEKASITTVLLVVTSTPHSKH